MKINKIEFKNEGYILCRSQFYSAHSGLKDDYRYTFTSGINKTVGDIDSGDWAASYLLSMYKYRPKDFILADNAVAYINDKKIELKELADNTCYMDRLYPLFSAKTSVKKLVLKGLNVSKIGFTTEFVRELFEIDSERFNRPLNCVGNEIFKAMAAIGYCYGKQIYCFPWLSKARFNGYHNHIIRVLDVLDSEGKIVILPIGF